MSKDISAAEEGIQTSKVRSAGIQVHPVNKKREQTSWILEVLSHGISYRNMK